MEAESGRSEVSIDLDSLRLGYLVCPRGASEDFLGGLLVVDGRGRPKHFAYVDPVRPTRMQQLLYNITLEPAARVDTIARELLTTLVQFPQIIFIDDNSLGDVQRLTEVPILHLAKSEHKSSFKPYTAKRVSNGAASEHALELIHSVDGQVDLLEPFERITLVLKETYKASSRSGATL